jgi:uncharacterized protein YkwD
LIALFAALLAAGLAACSGSHRSDQATTDIKTAVRTTAPGGPQPPSTRPLPNIRLREVLGETLSMPDSPAAAAIEDQFFALTNAARAAVRVAPLALDPDLDAYANVHVRLMAKNGQISHSNIASLLGPWWMVGENVGTGPNAPAIQAAYEHSPSHYQNITDSAFKYVGVGVVTVDGRIYTVEVYGI